MQRIIPVLATFSVLALAPATAGAQSTPVTITMPFSVTQLHTDIVGVRAFCQIRETTTTGSKRVIGSGTSTVIPLSQLSTQPDGSGSGSATISLTANRETTASTAEYQCQLDGCLASPATFSNGQSCSGFLPATFSGSDPRVRVQNQVVMLSETFTW